VNKARKLLNLIETSISDYIQGIGLKAKSVYWIDNLQGQECKIALVIYNVEDKGQQDFSVEEVMTQALQTALAKYIKPEVVKEILMGGIQFQPISNKPIEASRILVLDSNGITQFWGDFVK